MVDENINNVTGVPELVEKEVENKAEVAEDAPAAVEPEAAPEVPVVADTHPFLAALGADAKALAAKLDEDWHTFVFVGKKNGAEVVAWFESELKKITGANS